jgi:hypothetical protein
MSKYIIEGNINFYDELYKSLDDKSETTTESDNQLCLITNTPLIENYVTLECKHKFNYDAIFNDILCHKTKYNSMERNLIKQQELRCPYCRNIQKSLLPYVEGYKKVHGVNYYDETCETSKYNSYCYGSDYLVGKCEYYSIAKDANNNDVQDISHNCYNKYVKLLDSTGKCYCYLHYKTTVKKIEYDKKLKEKMEKKQALILEKQKAKEEKQKLKEEKQKMKEDQAKLNKEQKSKKLVKNVQNENVIISSSCQNIDETKCVQILKVGKNKGKQCFCKIYKDGFCLRHFNLNSKL